MTVARTLPGFDQGQLAAPPAQYGDPINIPPLRTRGAERWRLSVVSLGLAAAMLAITGKLVFTAAPSTVPTANASTLPAPAKQVQVTPGPNERSTLPRAKIFDRNGKLLAFSVPVHSLYAHPKEIPNADSTINALTEAFPSLDRDVIAERLASKSDFVYLARQLTPAEYFKALHLGLPGVQAQTEYRRVYPQGALASHVVGVTKADQTALSGIEAFFDADLVSAAQVPLTLSLDIRVQSIVRQELQQQIDLYAAKGGVGVVMDVRTGELVASVSLPDFDPNASGKRDPNQEMNRVSSGVYELGSVFKPIIAAIALDTNVAKSDTMFDASHPISINNYPIKDFHGKNRWLSMTEVLKYSSNIGAARIANVVGVERAKEYFGRFGLLTAPSMDLHEVQAPLVPKKWQELDVAMSSFGYSLNVSPAQFISAFSSLVNGGTLYSPTLLAINDPSTVQGTQVIRKETSDTLRTMLRSVVDGGTGRNGDSRLYPVGGKTGTALKRKEGGGSSSDKRISSFIGAFPIEQPRYVTFIMVDEPLERVDVTGRYATGGKVAAPAVSRIIDRIAPMLGIEPTPELSVATAGKHKSRGLQTASVRN
jgi:cell division protein FtsI (penicillin-binding protein 3)